MNKLFFSAVIGMTLFLGGCMLAPEYDRPEAPVPSELPSGAAYDGSSSSSEVPLVADLKWREFFPDPKLQQVIATALDNNRDLRLAVLNVERARALYGIQRAELFPAVTATGGGSKQRSSADLTESGYPRTTEQYNANLGVASWEIDFFGRIRSLKEQALQEYLATEEARRSAQIALVAEVARVYLTLAADRENLQLAQSTLETQLGSHDLIRLQYDEGVATELDLRRSQTQVDTASRNIAIYTQQVAQDQNALNLLAGSLVPDELLPVDFASVIPPKELSPGLSSETLLNRPDILAAENRLKGSYAYIGAARAAFFPRISLTAAIGTASDELSGLFSSGSDTWSFAPQIGMPIFDSRTWAAYRVSKATREIALAQYEKTIQTAFREVADALAVRGTVDQQIAAQQSIVDSAQTIYDLSNELFTQGVSGYFGVLDAHRTLYAAQQGLTYLQLARRANQVRLYAVLGGGGNLEVAEADFTN
ncbi:efflux transporter outer membrane subunit [Pontiella sulfatireligans]|uniref:Outer membrane protein OprM n=1 Tax=Pontiella sulfatireligans TaxID=2750658 RepID=A0A6C2ULK6_9BACT|nr:efflux transporter outer membrane subunit [Pontiella sulfatireligans]VGO21135.1 Outer membrane protein OprM [Pontiella sulfatireligans]